MTDTHECYIKSNKWKFHDNQYLHHGCCKHAVAIKDTWTPGPDEYRLVCGNHAPCFKCGKIKKSCKIVSRHRNGQLLGSVACYGCRPCIVASWVVGGMVGIGGAAAFGAFVLPHVILGLVAAGGSAAAFFTSAAYQHFAHTAHLAHICHHAAMHGLVPHH